MFHPSQFISIVRKEIAWDSRRGLTALKAALAGMLALFVADRFNMPHPYWILISIVMVNQGSVGGSLEKVAGRVLGTISGMTVVLIPIVFFPQERLFYALYLATFLFISGMGYAGQAAPQGFMRASVYGAVIGLIGIQSPETVPSYFGWRVLDVLLAAAIVLLVQVVLLPAYAANDYRRLLSKNRRDLARAFREIGDPKCRDQACKILREMAHASGQTGEKLLALAKQTEWENRDTDETGIWHKKALRLFEKLLLLGGGLAGAGEIPGEQAAASKLAQAIQSVLLRCAEVLEADTKNPAEPHGQALHECVAEMQQCYEELRQNGTLHQLPDSTIWALHGNMQAVAGIATLLEAIQKALQPDSQTCRPCNRRTLQGRSSFAEARQQSAVATIGDQNVENTTPITWDRIFAADIAGISFAFRFLIAVALMIWLVLALNWDNGVAAVISVCIITQSTLGRSYRKMTQRLLGCLLGGVAATLAVVFFVPHFTEFWQMALLLGGLLFASCYVASGGARFNYVGIQAALIMVILLVPDASQASNLGEFWDRLTGIFLACLVSVLVSKLVFPSTSGEKIQDLILTRIHLLADLFVRWLHADDTAETGVAHRETLRLTHAMYELDTLLLEAATEGERSLSSTQLAELSNSLDSATCAVLAIPEVRAGEFPARIRDSMAGPLAGLAESIRRLDTRSGDSIREGVDKFEAALVTLRSAQAFRDLPAASVRQIIGWAGLVREAGLQSAGLADALPAIRRDVPRT